MSKNSNVNNNRSQEPNNMFVQTTGGGKNAPKQIHVAHRRSQSELTNLMIEQFTLQKQLEQVQAQQQQLMAQQQQLAQQTGQYLSGNSGSNNHFTPQPPHPHYNSNGNSPGMSAGGSRSRTHSRNNSGYYHNSYDNNNNSNNPGSNSHRKTSSQSSIYGHSRRHSLGLNEAKKAAAEEQAKRISGGEAGVTVKIDSVQADSGSNSTTEQSDFKFPPPPNAHQGHRRATSNLSPPSFKFPPNSHGDNDDEFIATSSTHRRSKTRNNEYSPGINSNWRNQSQQPQQQLSPFRHRGSNSRTQTSCL